MLTSKSKFNVKLSLLLSIVFGVGACTCMARGPERFRDDTRAVIEGRSPQIKSCYDSALKASPALAGTVTVTFTVEKETGVFKDISLDKENTTAPDALSECVLTALDGLKLEPVDKRDGLAKFSWEFKSYEQQSAENTNP